MNRALPFILSSLLHLVFFCSLPNSLPKGEVYELSPAPQVQISRSAPSGSGVSRLLGKGAPNKRAKRLSLRQLLPTQSELGEIAKENREGALDGGGGGTSGGEDNFATLNSLGLETYAPLIPFFEGVWRAIDAATDYPEDFAKQRITGTVSVRVVLDKRGVLKENFINVQADHSYLEAYVLAVLVHALGDPLPERLWMKRETMPINLLFEFETYSDFSLRYRDRGNHMKNSLLIKRFAYVDPYLEEVIDEIFTKYLPPILPLGGGVFVDFVRLYQRIESMGKEDPDKLRAARLTMRKKQLDQEGKVPTRQ